MASVQPTPQLPQSNLLFKLSMKKYISMPNGSHFVYYPSDIFANNRKCLQKVDLKLHGMFNFHCSLVRFYEQTNMFPSL